MWSTSDFEVKALTKTIDVGKNSVSVSLDKFGTIHGLTTFSPKHGLVVAEPYAQFDGTRFYDSSFVREHRARSLRSLKAGTPGFGICLAIDNRDLEIEFNGLGCCSVSTNNGTGVTLTTKTQVQDDGEVIQTCLINNQGSRSQIIHYQVNLGVSVNRASYGQLTEGGPIPLPRSKNELKIGGDEGCIIIANSYLGARLHASFWDNHQRIDFSNQLSEKSFEDSPVAANLGQHFELRSGQSRELQARFRLSPWANTTTALIGLPRACISHPTLCKPRENQAHFIIRRNLEYVLGNCTIGVPSSAGAETVCLVTDHVALPLGWNRDNYWQARFLLDVHRRLPDLASRESSQTYREIITRTLRGHINWVFRKAQRPSKYWHRSYLVTGRPKDGPVFQLDQQCYPFLLLCDFHDQFPSEREFVKSLLSECVSSEVLTLIESKRDDRTGLYATEETPGDDAVEYPFHFSSQVLLWHMFSRLADLREEIDAAQAPDAARLRQLSESLRQATSRHFLVWGASESPMFAYLTDGNGLWKAYHDANDIPTLFASVWGFVKSKPERQAWENTLKFGVSEANRGGYYCNGPFTGLGSVHTPGPWPLGYFQMWRFAQMCGDRAAEKDAWDKICKSMQWDGTFSEAVDVETGECTSKAWFSWPGAMIGGGLLQDGVRERYL